MSTFFYDTTQDPSTIHVGGRVRSYDWQDFHLQILDYADSWGQKYVAPALAGDVDAAFSLYVALTSKKRGNMAVAFWRAGAPREVFRRMLGAVWDHDHHELIAAAGTRRRLRALFHYAQFDTSNLPDVVQVWRGASGLTAEQVESGYAWSLDRDVACWFAMRRTGTYGTPVVLTAHIPRKSVVFYTDERNEKEVVIFDMVDSFIDGTPDDWANRFIAHEENKEHMGKIMMAAHAHDRLKAGGSAS